eukprot:scaffold124341_cov47-Prasinocladus_malaysianus.AAC.1
MYGSQVEQLCPTRAVPTVSHTRLDTLGCLCKLERRTIKCFPAVHVKRCANQVVRIPSRREGAEAHVRPSRLRCVCQQL